jgi:quinol monooxygenase YgiN
MTDLVIISRMRARSDRQAEAERALRELIEPTHAEEGVLGYALHRGVDDPALFFLVERYQSKQAFDKHLDSSHVRAFASKAEGLFAEGPGFDALEGLPGGDSAKGVLSHEPAGS